MIRLDIKDNVQDVINQLTELGVNTKYLQQNILQKTIRGAQSSVKKSLRSSGLKVRTGKLLKSYKVKVYKDKGYAILFPYGMGGIATAHNEGLLIKAKSHKYLCFQVNGHWVKTKQIQLKKVPFFHDGISNYESTKMNEDVRIVTEKIIEKWNAKGQ